MQSAVDFTPFPRLDAVPVRGWFADDAHPLLGYIRNRGPEPVSRAHSRVREIPWRVPTIGAIIRTVSFCVANLVAATESHEWIDGSMERLVGADAEFSRHLGV